MQKLLKLHSDSAPDHRAKTDTTMKQWLLLIICAMIVAGCAEQRTRLLRAPPQPAQEQEKKEDYTDIRTRSYRARSRVPVEQRRYEGSLWKDEASWGNLFRDHRARFRGDLVKITKLDEVITVPEKEAEEEPPATGPAAQGEEAAAEAVKVLDAVTGMTKAEEEQREVLASLRSISAYVEKVLPNGNMVIVGEKVDYRQQNTVRYVTTVRGIIRPSDVNNDNEVPANKLARFEPKIKRQMLAKNLRSLAPVIGPQKAGLLDRLSHIATPNNSKPAAVNTR